MDSDFLAATLTFTVSFFFGQVQKHLLKRPGKSEMWPASGEEVERGKWWW
jgi:hypothetical protein